MRTVSIRRSLLTNLVVVVLLLGLAVLGMTYTAGRRARLRFSQSLIDQTLSRTEVELKRFFDPVGRHLSALRELGEAGRLGLEDPEGMVALLSAFMNEHAWVTSAMVATEDGHEHMLLRSGDGWRFRQSFASTRPTLWWTWTDDPAEREVRTEVVDYDPRGRPWFQGAVESSGTSGPGTVYWTEPYTFFTTKDPGITASTAFRLPDGSRRVIGLDVLLLDISRFTSTIEVHGEGVVFVLADDGRIVGLPRAPEDADETLLKTELLKRPGELETPLARDTSAALLDGDGIPDQAERFLSAGEAWWGQVRRFALSPDRHLVMGVVVREDDLLAGVREQRVWIGLLTLVALGLAIGRAVMLAGRYSRPVEMLVADSERMSRGDLEPGEPIETDVAEVHRLAEAHDTMRLGLQTLLKIEHDLKIARSIQESTFPERLPGLEGFDIAAWNAPADETGGDTYDVIGVHGASIGDKILLTDEEAGRAVLLLADATGHGIGPALSVTQVRAMLRIAVRASLDLGEVATHMNEQLCADLPSGRFVTCWLGELRAEDYTLTSVSAGQGPLVHYHAARDEFETPDTDTQPFGLLDLGPIAVPPPRVLEPGDIYAVLSDGIYETADPSGEDFGLERVQRVIHEHRKASARELQERLREAAEAFGQGAPAADDRTILIIKRT
jgi:serine phosphatase RsbU (regulator of sigma subunit)